jgi:ethanolamine utilization protein EutA
VSGNTIAVSNEETLPLHNLPVLYPRLNLDDEILASVVATAIQDAAHRLDLQEGDQPLALAFRWKGDPHYPRLRGLAEGISAGLPRSLERGLPLLLLTDRDVGKTLGSILKHDLGVASEVVSIDGVLLKEFDFVDIGEMIQPAGVVPVVIKSLLFSGAGERPRAL